MSDPHDTLVARALDLGLDVRGQSTAELREMIADPMTQSEQIAQAVWLHFIETGEPATAKDIAAATQRSASWVRKHWTNPKKMVEFADAYVTTFSKSFGYELPSRRVDALQPTRAYLRERVMELMAAAQGQS